VKSVTLPGSTTKPSRRRRGNGGFTLVEIAIVLAVMSVSLALGWPFLQQWKATLDLRSAADKVANVMLAARMRAVVDRGNYTVSVNYATDTCMVTPRVGTTLGGGRVDYYLDNTDPDCLSLSDGDIVFRPNGTADAAGFEAVYLKSLSEQVLVRYRVKVLGATGKVSVEKWAGGDWVGAY
jgi:prepilin-type N-terminal cleavage/methylation domain-containing protein